MGYFIVIQMMCVVALSGDSISTAADLNLINDSPRLLIASGKAITRNTRRISDIAVRPSANLISVQWNMTPASTEAFPCCPFTILEVYPLDGSGAKITGETVVLLKPNVTNYLINISSTNISEYLICVRLWHRFGGQERKLDESCIKSRIFIQESSTSLMIIIFAVVVTVNITLILTLIAVKFVRSSRKIEPGNFVLKKWWTDFADLLQPARSDESGRSSVTASSGILEPRNNTVNFLPSPYFTHRIKPENTFMNTDFNDLFPTLNNEIHHPHDSSSFSRTFQERDVVSSADSGISSVVNVNTTYQNSPPLTERLSQNIRISQMAATPSVSAMVGNGCFCLDRHRGDLYRLHQQQQLRLLETNNQLFIVADQAAHYNDASRIALV